MKTKWKKKKALQHVNKYFMCRDSSEHQHTCHGNSQCWSCFTPALLKPFLGVGCDFSVSQPFSTWSAKTAVLAMIHSLLSIFWCLGSLKFSSQKFLSARGGEDGACGGTAWEEAFSVKGDFGTGAISLISLLALPRSQLDLWPHNHLMYPQAAWSPDAFMNLSHLGINT